MKFKSRLKHSSSLIDLTPLVDVIFLMLIFFIVTSDILPLKSLNIENPELSADSAPLTSQLLVVMDEHQVIYVGSKKKIVDLNSLRSALQDEIKGFTDQHSGMTPTVDLSVDRRVDYGLFLQLFSIAQETTPKIRLVYQTSEEII